MIDIFIKIRILDLIDIFLVAFLMYQIYLLIKGTVAINIFIAILAFYLIYWIVKSLNMHLLSTILGAVIGVGVIAIIIVFQQEIRRFLLHVGSRYLSNRKFSFSALFKGRVQTLESFDIDTLIETCYNLAKSKTGALIVLARRSGVLSFAETGEKLNADFSDRLIESIFNKKSPLHDGAILIQDNKIIAARCVLPMTDRRNVHSSVGMRHRAAIGMSENTDAIVIVVSEERGNVSVALDGKLERNISRKKLKEYLTEHYTTYV